MAELVERLSRLSPEKLQLLRTRLKDESEFERPIAASCGAKKLLSYAQQRLWLLDLIQPESAAYNNAGAFRFIGALNISAFSWAVNAIVARHETLRTRFSVVDGEAVQIVAPSLEFACPIVDLSSLEADTRAAEARRLVEAEARRPFDLTQGPLLRVLVIDLGVGDAAGAREHVVAFTLHHIVSDGWSTDVLMREFAALYDARIAGRPSPLAPLPIQYADYAAWQRDWLRGELLERQLSYWRRTLSDAALVLELPTDHPRPAVQDTAGGMHRFEIPATVADRLKGLAREQGATLFMLLLAAFQLLLSRYSGQKDICVGVPAANRRRVELEGLIGFFVNTLVLRADLSGEPSFVELLGRVREAALGAQEHQDLPFERLVEELQPARDMSRSPLFQAMFVFQNAPARVFSLPGLRIETLAADSGTSKFDLTLELAEVEGGSIASIEYAAALFEPATIARMADHYRRLLEGIVADPRARIGALPMLSEPERRRLLIDWTDTSADFPRELCIHELFEAQAQRAPDAVAAIFRDDCLTYGELNARANRLARHLVGLGVGPETIVGLCVERSLEMVVGLLGVLKAGGAYLPLDPDYPSERLGYMIADASPRLVLTQERLAERLPAGTQILRLDADWELIADEGAGALGRRATPQNLAYVIYTSGSTGKPKGVAIAHVNTAAMLHWAKDIFIRPGASTMLASTSLCFDLSVFELFLPLSFGGAVVVVKNALEIAGVAGAYAAHLINTVPSAMAELLRIDALPPSVRIVNLAGEPFPPAMAESLGSRESLDGVFNLYGPSECTTYSSYIRLREEDWRNPPIGRPISNTQIFLLDDKLEPVPVGVSGEVYIGGAGVARGYLGRPDVTAERFVPDPFGAPGERMYRTGDLARWRADGNIEFLGRIDHQVKIRGFRIELGEIETALRSYVREAVVLARADASGDRRLVAYLTGEGELDIGALKTALRRELPDYMIPRLFVRLEALPLTANGKLDRKALPDPDPDAQPRHDYVAPRTPTEETLCRVFADVLGIERVGVEDNFFELGGHSLKAVRVIDQLRRRGVRADARMLFVAPTPAALALALNDRREVIVPPNLIPSAGGDITPEMVTLASLSRADIDHIVRSVPGGAANIQDIYPLAPLQEGILFHHLMSADGDPYLMPVQLAFQSHEATKRFIDALRAMIERNDVLRTAVLWEGLPEPMQVVWRHATLNVDYVNVESAEEMRARFDPRHTRLDVRTAPLMRAVVGHDEENSRWLLLLLTHHLALDHATLQFLVAEVQAYLSGQSHLASEPTPFRNFVAQARLGVSASRHEAFFTSLLGDVSEPTAPFGLVDIQGDGAIAEAKLALCASLAQCLRDSATRLGVSAASLFHLAFAQMLGKLTGRQDVVFGSVLLGRMSCGGGRALGLFINTLPMRIKLGEGSVVDCARNAHLLLADLLEHEHASLTLAQRCSKVTAPTPLFSALLNYRHSDPDDARSSAIEGAELIFADERTNYPLTLSVDDFGEAFLLTVQAAESIDPAKICDYMRVVLDALSSALEKARATPIRALDILTAAERGELIFDWNDTSADFPRDLCVHELFEAQAQRTPDAVAAIFRDDALTYGELNARANRLARHLVGLGVGPEAIVGLCVERSLEMVVGLLGVLKAGGAYLPLDPDYPSERLAYMIADASPRLVLTQQRLAERLPVGTPLLRLDADREQFAHENAEALGRRATPQNLAYVIYTSGSTGKPKGVAAPHGGVVNRIDWMQKRYGLTADDTVLQKTPFGFDVSAWEFFWPLQAGARLALAAPDDHREPARLVELIQRHSVTTLHFVPSMLQAFSSVVDMATLRSLRLVICSGEELPAAAARRFHAAAAAELHNLYGPTEASIDVSAYRCAPDDDSERVPIGRPISNIQLYILDAGFEPVPVGVAGELCIGGVGLARGYIGRADLTAERFVANPFVAGERMYRTGDLARWRRDGNIEFLGRLDHQVKIRGFRIELGEIEAVLQRLPGVREAVALAWADGPGDKRLAAYVTSEDELDFGALKIALRRELPDYMVPQLFVRLEALPLTASGKLDRKALPDPDPDAQSRRNYVAPRTPTEETLCRIFADVLSVERVGVDDSFFELGGHSLTVMQLVARVSNMLNVSLPISLVYRNDRLAVLAETVDLMKALNPSHSDRASSAAAFEEFEI
ncbi:amino acid adenylation domain-containing protein [Methylosinus sp. sav-2]|uniref:non-ribosomal peptide synthetase n=1 Tax=Methylosinus sp. sav-2 TaxID=2485168 RepID=UPI00068FF9B3|nr:non-ribosomal peptide synthetase [Methylosinus sp. sav-2]TDX61138.1 amino acid adenylation domain-containing protein [Methylosinus sp. sav-2]